MTRGHSNGSHYTLYNFRSFLRMISCRSEVSHLIKLRVRFPLCGTAILPSNTDSPIIETNLFDCFESHEQFFNYQATVTITCDRASNLNLRLALAALSSEGSFTCHTYCDTGPLFVRSHPNDPLFSLLNVVLLAKEQSLPILNVLGLTQERGSNSRPPGC
jgi:hypothetical protein